MANWLSRLLHHQQTGPLQQATLLINGWTASCSHCGGWARTEEEFHKHNRSGKANGCGARFTAFTVIDATTEAKIEGYQRARQDLIYIPPEDLEPSIYAPISF